MPDRNIDELHIENIDQVRLALADFDLLDEGFQENLHGNRLILLEYYLQVPKHELAHRQLFMVLDEQECNLLVDDGSVRVFLIGELVQQVEHELHQAESHYLGLVTDATLDLVHDIIDVIESLLDMGWIGSPDFNKEFDAVHTKLFRVPRVILSTFQGDLDPVIDGPALK